MSLPNRSLWLAKLALGTALLSWLLARTELGGLWSVLRSVDVLWLLPVLIVPHVGLLLSSVKWQVLLHAGGAHASLVTLVQLYLIGAFFNSFLPSVLGGDVVRMYHLSKTGCETHVAVASTFLERFVGLVALVSILPAAALQSRLVMALPGLWQIVGITSLLVACACIALFTRFGESVVKPAEDTSGVMARLRSILVRSRQKVQSFRGHPRALISSYLISVAFYLLAGVTVWCATHAVGRSPDLTTIVSVTPLVLLIGVIPVSIDGLGVLEAGYTWVLSALGLTLPEALAVALLLRCRRLLTAGIGGLIFLAFRRSSAALHGSSLVGQPRAS